MHAFHFIPLLALKRINATTNAAPAIPAEGSRELAGFELFPSVLSF
jgi:hypothetical protein